MDICDEEPIIRSDEYVFRFYIPVAIIGRVYLGHTAECLKYEPFLLDRCKQVWQPVYLLCQIIADVLSQEPSRLFNPSGTLLKVHQNIRVLPLRIYRLVDEPHLGFQLCVLLIGLYLLEELDDNWALLFVIKKF